MYRQYKCASISSDLVGKSIEVAGWVSSVRDHGGVKFIDLRDDSEILQIVAREDQIIHISK